MLTHRVLWIGESPTRATGFGRVSRQLMEGLSSYYEIACLALFHDKDVASSSRFRIYSADDNTKRDVLLTTLHKFQPHLVIALGDPWSLEWIPPLIGSVPFVGYVIIDGTPFAKRWCRLLQAMACPVFCSNFAERAVHAAGYSDRFEVIPHGVDTTIFKPLEETEKLVVPDQIRGKFVVGFVGRNQPRKQIPILVKAFAKFAAGRDDVFLYIHAIPSDVGWDLPSLLARFNLTEKAGITSNLHPTHSVSDEQLNQIYNQFDVLALPSTSEGFGLPILEALACGIPVVATDFSAIPELVQGRGELIRVKDWLTVGRYNIDQALADSEHLTSLLEKLYNNPILRADYGRAGRELAASMTWKHMVLKWFNFIEGVVGANSYRPEPPCFIRNADEFSPLLPLLK